MKDTEAYERSIVGRDMLLLIARILLAMLFIRFGWSKLMGFQATIDQMGLQGLPIPWLTASIVVIIELLVGLAIALGTLTRPLAILMALYALGTAFIGHPFWSMEGEARFVNEANFFKNFSICGGFLLLYVTGAGRYALRRPRPSHGERLTRKDADAP